MFCFTDMQHRISHKNRFRSHRLLVVDVLSVKALSFPLCNVAAVRQLAFAGPCKNHIAVPPSRELRSLPGYSISDMTQVALLGFLDESPAVQIPRIFCVHIRCLAHKAASMAGLACLLCSSGSGSTMPGRLKGCCDTLSRVWLGCVQCN